MKTTARRLAMLALATSLGMVAAPPRAQPYIGIAGGWGSFHENLGSEIPAAWQTIPGRTASVRVDDDSDGVWSVFGGWRFHPNFAVELGWHDFGRLSSRLFVRETLYDATLTHEVSGLGLSLVGSWPLTPTLSIYGRLGAMDAKVKYREQGFAVFDFSDSQRVDISRTDHSTAALFGMGLAWTLTPQFEARLDWTRVDGIGERWSLDRENTGRLDIDAFTVQLLYRF